jgi:hypothetical protein
MGNEEQETQQHAPPPPPEPVASAPPSLAINLPPGARLPHPGNAEWLLWFMVEVVFAIVWAASDAVDAGGFITATTVLTSAYLLSRGIAKASRVLEH